MFDFMKKFRKECVDAYEKFEEGKGEIREPLEKPKPIRVVIDGLLYDTSKAERICKYYVENEEMSVSGMMYGIAEAILFRSRNGRFFIQQYGQLYPCDERIAKNILKYEVDKYQEIFGEIEDA